MVNSTPIVLESGAQLNIPPSRIVHYVTTVLYILQQDPYGTEHDAIESKVNNIADYWL